MGADSRRKCPDCGADSVQLLISNVLLNRRATVQRAPEPDPNPSALRRWFTD